TYAPVLVLQYAAVGQFFGTRGIALMAIQSTIAFSLIETINYVEHYGLRRREISPGKYEPVLPHHSWNSSHRVSNWLLLNIPRHSDHHFDAARPFNTLRHWNQAPQLPAGYFAMFVLALFPPLWSRVMDPRVEEWRRNREKGDSYASAEISH